MIDTFYAIFRDEPLVVFGFILALTACAGSLARRARLKLTQRRDDPDPLRRVVLDASARFPPRASDRRVP